MPDADTIAAAAGLLARATARAGAQGRVLREEVRLAVSDELLRLIDEFEAGASWRSSEAHFVRRAGDAGAAGLLDAEAQAFRNVAAYMRANIRLLP